MIRFFNIPKAMVKASIRLYQKTFSLDHGPLRFLAPHGMCKFRPTCSEYGYKAIDQHGVLKGGWMTAKRIARCHPWSLGGHDPVPEK